MTVTQLAAAMQLEILVMSDGDRAVTGGYCGDLLSWVMGRAQAGDAWITVMGNVNAIAVAVLADVACIILSEQSVLDADAEQRARQQGVNILRSGQRTYELAACLAKQLGA